MASKDEIYVILTKIEDWLSWISFVRGAAIRRGVWNYINPDQNDLEAYPEPPVPPVCPILEKEDGSPVENIAELTEQSAVKIANYNADLQEFKDKEKGLDYIDDLIDRTTARRMKTYMMTATNVQEMLKLLKTHLRADKEILIMTLEIRWDALRNQSLCRSKLSAWVYEIQETYAQLNELDSTLVRGWKRYADVIDKIGTVSRVTASNIEHSFNAG